MHRGVLRARAVRPFQVRARWRWIVPHLLLMPPLLDALGRCLLPALLLEARLLLGTLDHRLLPALLLQPLLLSSLDRHLLPMLMLDPLLLGALDHRLVPTLRLCALAHLWARGLLSLVGFLPLTRALDGDLITAVGPR